MVRPGYPPNPPQVVLTIYPLIYPFHMQPDVAGGLVSTMFLLKGLGPVRFHVGWERPGSNCSSIPPSLPLAGARSCQRGKCTRGLSKGPERCRLKGEVGQGLTYTQVRLVRLVG